MRCISFLHSIRFIFSTINATVLININATFFKWQQINENYDDTSVGLFHDRHVKIQNLLVAYCKKKSRELHRVKNEEVKLQTAKRIGKNNDLREIQQHKFLDRFKDAFFLIKKSTLHYYGTLRRKKRMSLRKLLQNPTK